MGISLKQAALDYAAKGWPVFPCIENGKTPITEHGCLDATTDPKIITRWWNLRPNANIGFHVGAAGMMANDMDPGSNLKELEENVGLIPTTNLSSRTPRGGTHEYFLLREGEIVAPSTSKVAKFVDVRSFNSYTLLPPSRTKDGEYTWIEEGEPAPATKEMVRTANIGTREKHEDRDTWIIEADQDEHYKLAQDWLTDKAQLAIEGQGGDLMAYKTAAMMKGYGLSEQAALACMLDHWNDKCQPPWSPDELEVKVEHAYRYNTSPPGNMTKEYHKVKLLSLFPDKKTVLPSGNEIERGHFRFVDYAGMAHVKEPNWLINDFIPEDAYVIMWGAPSTYKTFLALDIALNIAAYGALNRTWPGTEHDGPVLYCAGEARSGIARKRIPAWLQHHGVSSCGVILCDPVPRTLDDEALFDKFIEGAKDMSPDGYAAVIIDTLGRSMAGTNENTQQDASAFTALVDVLRKKLDCTVIAIHHAGKEDARGVRGSSVFGADADTVIKIEKDGDYRVALTVEKQKDGQQWEKPKHFNLKEVTLDNGMKSLVVVSPTTDPKVKQQEIKEIIKAKMTHDNMDNAVAGYLHKYADRSFTDKDLAIGVAMSEGIDVKGSSIRTYWLPKLREDKASRTHRCFDNLRSQRVGKWRYKTR